MDLTVEKAFEILDNNRKGIPFEAIAYLYEQPTSQEILDKISYNLSNAYNDDVFYDEETDFTLPTPLWYAIVAEGHAHEDLIDCVISLFTTEDDCWDVLNEQGMFLVGVLCKELGEVAVDKFITAITKYSKVKYNYPVLFMHDAIFYADQVAYHDRIKALLKFNTLYVESLAVALAHAQYKSLLPALQSLYDFCKFKEIKGEVEPWQENVQYELAEVIKELKSGKCLYPEQAKPYIETRESWQKVYQDLVSLFDAD